MEEEMASVMKYLKWNNDGFRVLFANEENKILENKLEIALKEKNNVKLKLKNSKNDLKALQNYFLTIVERRSENERMLVDYRRQCEVEKKLLDNERHEKLRLLRDAEEATSRANILDVDNTQLKTRIGELHRKCDKLRKNIEWAKELEDCWTQCVSKERENCDVLERYNCEDDSKFQELEVKRSRLMQETTTYERLLNEKLVEIRAVDNSIKKTDQFCKNLYKERRWLVSQWQNVAHNVKCRDRNIDDILRDANICTEVLHNVENTLLECANFYKEQARNNEILQADISRLTAETGRQEVANDRLTQNTSSVMNRAAEQDMELSFTGKKVRQRRIVNTLITRQINQLRSKISNVESTNEKLKIKVQNLKNRNSSIVNRTEPLENILQNENNELRALSGERMKLGRHLTIISRDIATTHLRYDEIRLEIKRCGNIKSNLIKIKEGYIAQRKARSKILEKVTLDIEHITTNIRFFSNIDSDESENELKKNQLDALIGDKKIRKNDLNAVFSQISKCNVELEKLKKEAESYRRDRQIQVIRHQELLVVTEAGEKLLAKITETNKEKEMAENIFRLRLNQLENGLTANVKKLIRTEERRINLEMVLKERLEEIRRSSDKVKSNRKNLLEEVSELNRSVEYYTHRVEQHIKKHEIVTNSLGTDDQGRPLTVDNYKMQLVKERYALLEKGDYLDEKIREMEKRIKATENTLLLLSATNDKLKKPFALNIISTLDTSVEDEFEITKEQEELNKKYQELDKLAKKYKTSIPLVTMEIETIKYSIIARQDEQKEIERSIEQEKRRIHRLQKEVDDYKLKLERVKRLIASHKLKFKPHDNVNLLELGFLAKELRNTNKIALERITRLIADHPKIRSIIVQRLSQRGVTLATNESATDDSQKFAKQID